MKYGNAATVLLVAYSVRCAAAAGVAGSTRRGGSSSSSQTRRRVLRQASTSMLPRRVARGGGCGGGGSAPRRRGERRRRHWSPSDAGWMGRGGAPVTVPLPLVSCAPPPPQPPQRLTVLMDGRLTDGLLLGGRITIRFDRVILEWALGNGAARIGTTMSSTDDSPFPRGSRLLGVRYRDRNGDYALQEVGVKTIRCEI